MVNIEKSYEVMKRVKRIKDSFHFMMEAQLKELNLTAPQGMLVGMLARHGAMRISDISEKMGLSNSTVSELVSRLEKNGVLKREKSETDGRVVMVKMDETFKKNSKCIFEEIEAIWVSKIGKAEPEEIDKIIEGLSILEKLLTGGEHDETH